MDAYIISISGIELGMRDPERDQLMRSNKAIFPTDTTLPCPKTLGTGRNYRVYFWAPAEQLERTIRAILGHCLENTELIVQKAIKENLPDSFPMVDLIEIYNRSLERRVSQTSS